MDYKHKIDFAIKLMREIPQDGPIELAYSGGKDSDVILELAKMSGIPFVPIYKQTSIDPPGTTKHVKEMGVEIRRPKETFFHLVERKGSPSRFKRFCCQYLKEYKIYDRVIVGVRRSESISRAKRYKEPEVCRVYSKTERVRQYLPILEWTNDDVMRFIEERSLRCAPVYYDEGGAFHVERRLGCIGCPLKSDNGLADFKTYPKFLKQYLRSYQKYLDNHTGTDWYKRISGSAINATFYYLFCRSDSEYQEIVGDAQLFPYEKVNPKRYMEEYFNIDLTL